MGDLLRCPSSKAPHVHNKYAPGFLVGDASHLIPFCKHALASLWGFEPPILDLPPPISPLSTNDFCKNTTI